MTHKISLKGNITLTAAPAIASICKPLQKSLNIPFFRYARIFKKQGGQVQNWYRFANHLATN